MSSLADHYRDLITGLGEDVNRSGLKDTPLRAAEALLYLTKGYRESISEVVGDAVYESDNDQMVIVKNIELYSLCEHHIMPFVGHCHVGYLPSGKVLGISKVARIVEHFARRLQIQENLTKEIADCIQDVTNAEGVGVVIEAKHFCMMMRGVEKQNAITTTSMMLGSFRANEKTRSEFLTLIK